MQGLRIFDHFGFNLPEEGLKKGIRATVDKKYEEWVFEPKQLDWLHAKNETTLSNYRPPMELVELLENKIEYR